MAAPKKPPPSVLQQRRKTKVTYDRKKTKAQPGPGFVQLATNDPPISISARLSDERPNVEQGYGGWDEVARPKRRPLTTWSGLPALRMTLPLLFDGLADGNSQEKKIGDLERMATATAKNGQPPLVHISHTGRAVPHQERTWVITDLTWGDALMNERGNRVRQQVTVGLLEYVADAFIQMRSAATRERQKATATAERPSATAKRVASHHGKSAAKTTTRAQAAPDDFGQGEDLLSLAARELGDADRWLEIAMLNGIRDPRSIRFGQVIRLP